MIKSSACVLSAILCVCGSSCTATKPAKPETEKPKIAVEEAKLVGRIASIPADKRFVLIQSYGKWTIESGQILTTRGPNERSANLRTTGETLGEFAAADLQSGAVEVGDAVYFQHSPAPTNPEVIQNQSAAHP